MWLSVGRWKPALVLTAVPPPPPLSVACLLCPQPAGRDRTPRRQCERERESRGRRARCLQLPRAPARSKSLLSKREGEGGRGSGAMLMHWLMEISCQGSVLVEGAGDPVGL